MSSECDKCGEHALECGCPKHIAGPNDKFYYQGKFFEKKEEFLSYVKDFTLRQTNTEDFDGLFDMLKKNIWLNLAMRKTKISNGELRTVLEDAFAFILEKCWKNEK